MEEFTSKTTTDQVKTSENPEAEPYPCPSFSPQFAAPVYLSFPPPPCAPSPINPPQLVTNVQGMDPMQGHQPMKQYVGSNGEGIVQSNQQYCTAHPNDNIEQMTDVFSNNLKLDTNEVSGIPLSRPDSVESPAVVEYAVPPYSVVVPPGTFIHHLGGSVPPHLYQQFSPVLPTTIPLHHIHQVYPLNTLNTREQMHPKPPFVTTSSRQVITPEPTQDFQGQVVPSATMYTSHVPEGTWSVHPAVTGNPTFYWGHYMQGTEKPHGIPLTSQPLLRRHSVCEEPVVTPTNVCPPCNLAGIVSATPEFIHPRKPDVPQWLMSPPVGEQDPSIISYAPMMYRNVRVPSVTGMAIPVVAPVGSGAPVGVEPIKFDSPTLVLSPVPCYENPPQNAPIEPPQEARCEAIAPSDPSMQKPPPVMEQSLAGPPLFKRVAELQHQQQIPCWQCVSDKTPEVKHPTPDLFNRWPNIPPPPAPPAEEESCRDVQSINHLVTDVLPLAAALFHSDPGMCCQDEDLQMPQTYPIGVFWDIENCAVPSGKSALGIVQRVRERLFAGHKEAEFMCVCDINKESKHVIRDLNHAQVNVVHISAVAKNAADDKLRQSIRRFAHNHPAPATLVLITGDSNFTAEVSDLRHRHKYFVVLIHPVHASPSLIQTATTAISYEQLVADLPVVNLPPKYVTEAQLLVSNLPRDYDPNVIRRKLLQLSENCGGKVVKNTYGTAVLKFANTEAANRALKRLQGEDVFGNLIDVTILHQSPRKYNRNFSNNVGPFSPTRQPNNNLPQSNDIKTSKSQDEHMPTYGSDQPPKPTVNLTPGHCDPPLGSRPRFVPISEPIASGSAPPPNYPMIHPPGPPPCSISVYNHNPAPNPTHHGYNSMPPPPQPQLFQPPHQYRKDDNQQIGVKMTISNIDAQLGINAIQDILWKQITEHCQVLDMRVRPHNRFTVVCDVVVPRVGDASRVLQHLQRKKFGTKRVLVTLTQPTAEDALSEDLMNLKRDCFAILKEISGGGMPLYRFLTQYKKRYNRKAKMEEIRLISDVVMVQEGPSGTNIFLNSKIKDEHALERHLATYPRSGRSTPDINHDFLLPVCKLHYPADAPRPPSVECAGGLLKIEMGLREFSAKLHALLHSHNGILQLDGFEYCYRAEYGNFPVPRDIHEGGVIAEHQASYVPGVQIIMSQPHCLGVKAIVWAQPQSDAGSDTASDTSGASRWKSPNLIQFSREVVELLKDRPYCCLPYDGFSSAYHRHFGRACRVSDYGFTRLSDLLAAIPHVLQIMGSLSNRILTLTHRAQVKRFTQEVVKILKTTPDRAILVAQMPELYNRTFNRAWKLRDYGVSVLSDLLDDIPEGHICTTGEGDNIVLSLPVRERTAEERERTNQFAREVIKILRSRPHYRMPFTEFVPTYHRQFGRQCKLANYGFSKLIDLFEALPHVVQITERSSEKLLALTETEQHKILSMQITSILRAQMPPNRPHMMQVNHSGDHGQKNLSDGPMLPLACIPALFQQKYNFPLVPQDFGATDLDDLTKKLSHAVRVVLNKTGDKMIKLAERKPLRLLSAQLLALLLDQKSDQLDAEQLHSMYSERYKENIEPTEYGFLSLPDLIRKALPGVVKMDLNASECLIHLCPLYKEARIIRSILLKNNGSMTIGEFNFAYRSVHNASLDFRCYGFQTCEALLRALPNVLVMKGIGLKKTIMLRNHMLHGPLSAASGGQEHNDGISGSASMDNLQSFSATSSRASMWVPEEPPAVPAYWRSNGDQPQNLVSSASMGDFRTEEEKRRKERMAIAEKSTESWLPSTQPVAPAYSGSYYFQYSKTNSSPATDTNNSLPQKTAKFDSPQTICSSACTFTVGEVSTSNNINQDTPMRRGISVSVITLPNGSTPIASTSSCSSGSTPGSIRSSRTSESSVDYSESCSSDENCALENEVLCAEKSRLSNHGVASLPNSPFARITGKAYIGPLSSVQNGHSQPDSISPGRIHLAASFPTLAHN